MAALAMAVPQRLAAQEADDHARRRWEDFSQRRAYPFERIPPAALERARAQYSALKAGGIFPAPPIAGTQWQSVGPTSIGIGSTAAAGRATAIAVHPTNSNIVYIGGAQGGVWKTVDGGATWTPLTDKECSLAMGAIALDPVDPQIVYAGTGELHFSGDSYYGCGVLRSTDGGATWTRLGASVFATSSGGARIARIAIAPRTAGSPATSTVLAASDFGVYRSTDGGLTWTRTLLGIATDLVMHPTNDSILYAATYSQGVYQSTNRGATWTKLTSGLPTISVGRINLALAPSAPEMLFASVHNTSNSQLLGIWRTTDGGATWSQLSATGASCGNQCWYDMFIAVHPSDPSTVYFGGVSLYRSRDAGASFENISSGKIHVDQHFLAFDPQNAQTVYVANDGGIYRSLDAGTTWTSLNNGLAITQFYEGISLHPSDRTIALGGTQDNGTLLYTGSATWQPVLGGDGGFTAIDRDNPQIRYAETQWGGSGGPRRSDGGSFFLKTNGIATSDRALFIPPLVMDPTTSATLYFGTYLIYRTTNRADSWAPFSSDLSGGGAISAIAPAPSNPQVVYVGSNWASAYVTTDGGATWTLRTTGLPNRFIEGFAVDRADWQTAYAVVSGFGTGHVFRTTDGGQNWVNRSGNLPNVPVNAVLVDPASRGIVIIGTDLGVFMSADSGGTWTPLDQAFPNVAVFDIAYNPATATLIAATHGRGMFQLQLDRPLTLAVVPATRRDSIVSSTSSPHSDSATVLLTGLGAASAGWSATHRTAATWLTLGSSAGTGTGKLLWTRNPAGLPNGVYVDTITISAPGAFDSPSRILDSMVVGLPTGLTVTALNGSRGSGTVTSNPGGINCIIADGVAGGTCLANYIQNSSVTLTATAADANNVFLGWSGACTNASSVCTVTMDAAKTATANFEDAYTLTVIATAGSQGSGVVTSQDGLSPTISCTITDGVASGTCSQTYARNIIVDLTAAAGGADNVFVAWGGSDGAGCATNPGCSVSMTAPRTLSANFEDLFALTVTALDGSQGSGTVTSQNGLSPAISCTITDGVPSGTCSQAYVRNTAVVLTAAAATGNGFVGWGGSDGSGCAASTSCSIAMTVTRTLSANFEDLFTLTVAARAGSQGNGTVTSQSGLSPSIGCTITGSVASGSCIQNYARNTVVVLTAAPAAGNGLLAWGGSDGASCAPATSCTVSMTAARSLDAGFAPALVTVIRALDTLAKVTVDGTSYGRFAEVLAEGSTHLISMVSPQLSTRGNTQYGFASWSDGGAQIHSIVGSLAGDSITLNLTIQHKVRVTTTGTGTVTSAPVVDLANGTFLSQNATIRLSATASGGQIFDRWTGDTTSTSSSLTLIMIKPFTLNAAFVAPLAISSPAPPNGVMGRQYSFTFSATGGDGTRSWSVRSGNLPSGLSLTAAGVLSGTLAAAGAFSAVVGVTSATQSAEVPVTLTIAEPVLTVANVLNHLLGIGASLSAEEIRYLDLIGNNNGGYDVGDFLAWVKKTGASPVSPAAERAIRRDREGPVDP
ncbi:MAG: hypothetical protein HY700_17705 [Gemmatimonadetes bacterium]|nr:hypothetical protein [Gemmatimonadota bacterium]